jgi:hypothetical protein
MPVARTCFYCRKTFLKSTHEMFSHVQSCSKYKEVIKTQSNNNNNNNNHKTPAKVYVKSELSIHPFF